MKILNIFKQNQNLKKIIYKISKNFNTLRIYHIQFFKAISIINIMFFNIYLVYTINNKF